MISGYPLSHVRCCISAVTGSFAESQTARSVSLLGGPAGQTETGRHCQLAAPSHVFHDVRRGCDRFAYRTTEKRPVLTVVASFISARRR